MRRLLSSWLSFRPERVAFYALLCGLVTLVGLGLFLACLFNEALVDRLFPFLVLYAPIAATCAPLSLTLGAFALISSPWRMAKRPLRFAYFSVTVALGALLLVGVTWRQTIPSRSVPSSLALRRRFYAAQQARASIREVNWKNLRLFPPPQLSPQTTARLREVKAMYEGLREIWDDTPRTYESAERMLFLSRHSIPLPAPPRYTEPSLRYWLGCVNALLGHHAEAMRNFMLPSRVPTPDGGRNMRELWAEIAANLAQTTSPCEVALVTGNREDAHLIATDPLAEAFLAKSQWREAAWRFERRLQVIYWRYRWTNPQIRYVPIPERVAQSYEKWAENARASSLEKTLWERAAKANTNAARYEEKRAGEFHLKAGACWMKAGYPWRALVSFERAKKATKDKTLLAQVERRRRLVEANLINADPTLTPSRVAERTKQFVAATKPFDDAERYYMAYDPDKAIRMLREFMQKCPDANDPLMDDALWNVSQCEQSEFRHERVERKRTVWITVNGKRTRRTQTEIFYQRKSRRRRPEDARPVLRELLNRFPQSDRAPEAIASAAQIDYYGNNTIKEVQAYLELLRQYPDAPVVPKVLTLMWRALYNQWRFSTPEKVLAELHLTNDVEREAVKSVLIFWHGLQSFPTETNVAVIKQLHDVDLTTSNRLLRGIADVSLGITPKPLASAPFALGKLYYLKRDWKNAEKQFRKVLEHSDVYNYHGWARYRLARCLENQGRWLDALRELAQIVGAMPPCQPLESNAPMEESSPASAARWRVNFILDAKFSRAQLEKHERNVRALGLSPEWEMAMIARDLRDERLRDAVRRIETFVVRRPHHPQARALFARLCQLERNLIPTAEMRQASSLIPHPSSLIIQWTQRLLRAQSDFKRKMKLHLSQRHPMDDVLFEARLRPQAFRSQRVLHRFVNRMAWHSRFWLAYDGPPDAERCDFDHAFYYARHPLALKNYSGMEANANAAFPACWGTAFDPWDRDVAEKSWQPSDAMAAADYLMPQHRAGVLFDQFATNHPNSRLLPRALLMSLQAHERYLEVIKQARAHGTHVLPPAWHKAFQHAKHDFTLLRAKYRGSREERLGAPSRCRCQMGKEVIPESIASGPGLIAHYWQGWYLPEKVGRSNFTQPSFDLTNALGQPVYSRIEGPVNHATSDDSSWDLQRRSPQFASLDKFGGEWTGLVQIPSTGVYGFGTLSDGDSYVWIDGKMVVQNDNANVPQFKSGQVQLKAGQQYGIRIRYAKSSGGNVLVLKWQPPGKEWSVVPMKNLSY